MGHKTTINLISPANDTVISTPLTVILKWQAPGEGKSKVVLATDRRLKNKVAEATVDGSEWRVAVCPETEYWWRVEKR